MLAGWAAAMLAIPLMTEETAAKLAEAEGIVCHLTSLVLVDEAGATHAAIPAVRKVRLSTPLSARRMAMSTGLVLSALSPDEMAARTLALANPSDGMKYCIEPDSDSYARASGRPVETIVFHYVTALYKVAVIAQQIYARYRQGLTQDERFGALGMAVQMLAHLAVQASERGRISRLLD